MSSFSDRMLLTHHAYSMVSHAEDLKPNDQFYFQAVKILEDIRKLKAHVRNMIDAWPEEKEEDEIDLTEWEF